MRKRAIAVLAALAMSAGVALAAQHPRHMRGTSVDNQVAKMKSSLNLNDQQAGQVKSLFEKQMQEMHAWRQSNPQATRDAMRAQHQKWMQEREDGLKTILTPDQFKTYQSNMEKHRGMKRGSAPPAQK
ncbi:MAG TPA: hypothetical protein VGS20_05850 [Candidatus Acidoferrales bacterium]|nr:hypothetical protein [Candidatus Acidoferrales bacterium]